MATTRNYPETRKSLSQPLLAYLTENADRVITLDELHQQLGSSVTRNSIASGMGRLLDMYPNLERPQRGVYIWHSTPREKEPECPGELLVKVLKQTGDGRLLVIDEDTNTVYVMKEVEI